MTSRLDRLLTLLDTGSSTSVRSTAAKQVAQLAVKSVISDVTIVEDDVKTGSRQQIPVNDSSAWGELLSVVARIIPFLHSKSFESRTAASTALSQIFSLVPVWIPSYERLGLPFMEEDSNPLPSPEFPKFSVQELVAQGNLLLSSSGKEFIKPIGILPSVSEVKKARKEAMNRLGLGFLDTDDDDMELEKEFAAEMDVDTPEDAINQVDSSTQTAMDVCQLDPSVNKDPSPSTRSVTPSAIPSPSNTDAPTEIDTGQLSARERNRLKRKRKPGNSAFVAPPPQTAGSKYITAPAGSSNKQAFRLLPHLLFAKVDFRARILNPDDKTATSSRLSSPAPNTNSGSECPKGGAVAPKSAKQSKALEVENGLWIWDGVVNVLEVDLFSPAWEVRHGAAMALRELLKLQGKCGGMRDDFSPKANATAHEKWCNDLAAKLLCIFVLDRFSDFVSDQVVAPVRETVSQTLASLILHMPRMSLLHVHLVLLQMIRQEFSANVPRKSQKETDKGLIWEIRHAGLLGIKYEVAVRSDLFDLVKGESDTEIGGRGVLEDVVQAAILGLNDGDDDVKSVAASCLLPVAEHIVEQLPESLDRILVVLWQCLSNMKDDLSSSVGVVMDLLSKLVAYDKVIQILAKDSPTLPLSTLAQTLFPFFRHTIPNVRLAVVRTLHSFMVVQSLPRDWIAAPFLSLLFQNMICEERMDIRDASLTAWKTALTAIPGHLENVVTQQMIIDWYAIMMTPLGVPIDVSTFYTPSMHLEGNTPSERHNVDKKMISQDLSLISVDIIINARLATATALGYLMVCWMSDKNVIESCFKPILLHYLDSSSMLQKFLTAVVAEEWARQYEAFSSETSVSLVDTSSLAREITTKTLDWLQGKTPPAYHEMALALNRIHVETVSLLQMFATDCKLPMSSVPFLGNEIDITGTKEKAFTIDRANWALDREYNRLKDSLGRTKKRELGVIAEKRTSVLANIARYNDTKAQHEVRVSAAFAAAFVAFKSTPDKVSPVVKGIMNGIKSEENEDLQKRSAFAVATFVRFCIQNRLTQPPDKIVKNLCTFLCQDVEQTPTFACMRESVNGILSFSLLNLSSTSRSTKEAIGGEGDKSDEVQKAKLARRGASHAFRELSDQFGDKLLDTIPTMWQSVAGGLLSACHSNSLDKSDELIEKQYGQDVIDSLSVLEAVVPTFHNGLLHKLQELFPMMDIALRSRFAIVRQAAARCFATLCDVVTLEAMRYVVESVIPFLQDPLVATNRQGTMELIYHIVNRLDIKALPYIIFMVVPVLGRMSDSNHEIRATASNTFASLVKMIPLEVGLPDPPGFSDELLKRRDTEREFLSQLLDGSKVEKYTLPVKINAELRKYQQDGVNWLAFLAKYQLHGILCDDMGLGKTLQSICILAGKHFERAQKHLETGSADSVHLTSLIICPPTLTGHWYYEIQKYSENLRPVLYTGNSRERTRLLTKLKSYDIVITSYEVVRNDISNLECLKWLYCILDEGHIIKNAKTKLTKAVKCIQAQHRLVLSGTPIQNNVLELWSLFDFLMPGFLGTESSFNERFSKPILSNRDGKAKNSEAAVLALEALHKQVLPFLLRRLKEDVLNDLPPKIIQDYYCELSDLQKYLYDDFARSKGGVSATDMVKTDKSNASEGGQRHIFQSLQYLRKLCNHPALVLKDNKEAIEAALGHIPGGTKSSLRDIQHAPKLQALRQLLLDCGIGSAPPSAEVEKSEMADVTDSDQSFSQHRVLIFCQMKQMLDIIENDLFKAHMPSVTYMRLDGNTDASKRHPVVQTFNTDPSIDCLLLTTHVGGLGLTLTGADTVIFVEHDWNPMKDLQAMDRAHRLGQKKVVNVYRLITKGTLEEKIMGLQRFKLNIVNSVVTQQNSGLTSMDTDLVLDLFRRTSEEEEALATAKAHAKEPTTGPVSQKNVLQGLEDLPAEDEYEGLDLSSFMGSLGR